MSFKDLPFQTLSIATCAIPRRDTYGFTLPGLTAIPPEEQRKAQQAALRRISILKAAWLRKLQSFKKKHNNKGSLFSERKLFKFLARKGIPPELRGEVWYEMSGGKERKESMPMDYYEKISQEGNMRVFVCGIMEEIRIMFKEHDALRRGYGVVTISRVLTAMCKHRPWIKLTSSLIKMVGFLFVVLGPDKEEEMFWILDAVIDDILGINSSKQVILNLNY